MSSHSGKVRLNILFFLPQELANPEKRFTKSICLFLIALSLYIELALFLIHLTHAHFALVILHGGVFLILGASLALFRLFFQPRWWIFSYVFSFYLLSWFLIFLGDPFSAALWLALLPTATLFLSGRFSALVVWVLVSMTALVTEAQFPALTLQSFLRPLTGEIPFPYLLVLSWLSLSLAAMASVFFALIKRNLKLYGEQKNEVIDLLKKSQESEKKFLQQINFLQTLMDLIPFPLFAKDMHGHFISCNPAFSVVFDIARDRVLDATNTSVFSSINAQTMEKIELEVFSREIMAAEEVSLIHADGQRHEFIVYFMPFVGIDQQMEGYIGVLIDISERKTREAKLVRLNETKDQLFSIISHDLRGPVGKIKQLLDVYVEDRDIFDTASWAQVFDDMRKSADSLYLLLENLLSWARTQKGDYKVRPEVFPLEPLVSEVFSLQKLLSNDKKIQLSTEIELHGQLLSDKTILSTILRNLVHNAVKFTAEGGEVIVSAHETPDEVLICVTDTGVGIPSDTLKKILLKQERISTHGTGKEKGQGIGLGLCIDLAALIGARLTAQSALGRGTTFTLTLPTTEL